MAYLPRKGDVITYPWPNDDPLIVEKTKNRPCIILKIISDVLVLTCVTTRDKSNFCNGIWIDEKHNAFEPMRLRKPSFINLKILKYYRQY